MTRRLHLVTPELKAERWGNYAKTFLYIVSRSHALHGHSAAHRFQRARALPGLSRSNDNRAMPWKELLRKLYNFALAAAPEHLDDFRPTKASAVFS